jgi:hypothetical protein
MSALRILILAPESNPESVTNPAVGYYHAEALARHHAVTLVIHASKRGGMPGRNPFHSIERFGCPARSFAWAVKRVFKYDYGRQSLTAAMYPRQVFFELRAWRQLRSRIRSGDFDVVLRILPYISVLPSPFAWLLRNGPIPFVIGPVSGGLPWAKGFRQLEKRGRAW